MCLFIHHCLLHKFRFVSPLKDKSFNPRCKLLMLDVALEGLAFQQLCAFAARRKAFVRLAGQVNVLIIVGAAYHQIRKPIKMVS